jgi:hypothetical protein
VQKTGIRIVHSLAVFETRDLSSTINDDTHRLRAILRPRLNGIDTDDTAPYSVAMVIGKRRRRAKQTSMWVATGDLPRTAAHPFYTRLNHILERHDFEAKSRILPHDSRAGYTSGLTAVERIGPAPRS